MQDLVASLCSDCEELTDRHPCRIVDGHPYVNANFTAREGVADQLVVWCADCGGFVGRHPLQKLVVFSDGRASTVDLPAVPMHYGPRGEA